MSTATWSVMSYIAGAAILGTLGALHLVFTGFTQRFDPRDATLVPAMQATSPRLTRDTSMWRCWIGFNASHSLGVLLFAALYGLLATRHAEVLRASSMLAWLAPAGAAAYTVLAWRYWFRVPLTGAALATACFCAGAALLGA